MKHKLGIIGFGGVAGYTSKRIAEGVPNLTVAAAYDIDPAKLKAAAERGIKAHDTLEGLLADDVDIVLVATPNQFHKPMTIAALEAGKHVVCEKPVAMSLAEFDAMCAAAQKANRFFCVHQNRRWDRDYLTVKKVIEDGTIGKPYAIESRVQGGKGFMHGWRADPASGGGMVFDWGPHLIDQVLRLVPEPVVRIDCYLHNVKCPDVDDYFKMLMRFENGVKAHVEVGIYHYIKLPRWYVCGDEGDIQLDDWSCKGRLVRVKPLDSDWDDTIALTEAGPTRTMAPRPADTVEELPIPEVATDWGDFYKNVMACIEGREEQLIKLPESRRVMQVIEAAFESNRTGRSVTDRI
jgi:predicted dehydrogenase